MCFLSMDTWEDAFTHESFRARAAAYGFHFLRFWLEAAYLLPAIPHGVTTAFLARSLPVCPKRLWPPEAGHLPLQRHTACQRDASFHPASSTASQSDAAAHPASSPTSREDVATHLTGPSTRRCNAAAHPSSSRTSQEGRFGVYVDCTWRVRGLYVECSIWAWRNVACTWTVRGVYVDCTWRVRGLYVECSICAWRNDPDPEKACDLHLHCGEVLDVYVPAHTLARVLSSQQQEQQQQQQQQQQGGSQNLSYDTPTPASMQGCYPAAPVVLFTHGGVWASVLVGISWPWPCFTGLRWPEGPLQTLPPPVILRKPPQGQRVHPASNPTSPPLPHLHHHCRRRIYHANPQMVFLKHHQNQFAAGIEQARSSPSAAFAPGEKGHPGWRGHIFTPHIYMAQGVSRWKFAGGTATES
ncbi:hypothetical protein DUNSADRAFT_14930 [Dunaliella salina]|uniref:Uncharacterized protein n=1 Tax=Dunaliella salina TaxID=3046 RepID=A0ABQ7G6D9_DUNSA|nr:hypothetical protein DUNSADRAFT_14930 [Dunaliella salina]|eukprot:KAF5830175.1 hypothetical protein DUNSADRAFT_14930 [Dunaliella salina]